MATVLLKAIIKITDKSEIKAKQIRIKRKQLRISVFNLQNIEMFDFR